MTRHQMDSAPARPTRPQGSYSLRLGNKALLTLFGALAAICGMFFSFGYTMGKHAIPATFTLGGPQMAAAKPPAPAANPAATLPGVQPPNPNGLSAAEADQTPQTLTNPPAAANATPPDVTTAPTVPAANPPATTAKPSAAGVYNVQVFAGSQSDANSLAQALQTKGYPSSVVAPNPGEANIYRVLVGPYLTVDEAQAMKSRLTADGYQAILKP